MSSKGEDQPFATESSPDEYRITYHASGMRSPDEFRTKILYALAEGLDYGAIGRRHGFSVNAAKYHVRQLLHMYRVENAMQAVTRAIQLGHIYPALVVLPMVKHTSRRIHDIEHHADQADD